MHKIGIVGGAGYTAGELTRILLRHPDCEIAWIHSNSHAEQPVYQVHTDLIGETDLIFTNQIDTDIDALFLCSGHGKSKSFLENNPFPENVKIIDLSSDFRLKAEGNDFVYGLPELNREAITQSSKIANPGCFATCIQLGLLPLAAAGQLQDEVHIHAITGSTGAGQKPLSTTHFSWRNNNMSIYKAFSHQHLGEINQSLKQLQEDFTHEVNFLPLRGDFPRGIYASLYIKSDLSEAAAKMLYQNYYQDHPFTVVSEFNPHLKQVVNTNKGVVFVEKHGNKLLIISMIDNLLKGASGQAVQNMNLMLGLSEKAGLDLKALAF